MALKSFLFAHPRSIPKMFRPHLVALVNLTLCIYRQYFVNMVRIAKFHEFSELHALFEKKKKYDTVISNYFT